MQPANDSENWVWNKTEPGAGELWQRLSVGSGRTSVWLEARRQGVDWILCVGGGRAHVGASATAWPGGWNLTVVGNHREGPLAEKVARSWTDLTGKTCVAVVGIHQDAATAEEIAALVRHVELGLDLLRKKWREASVD